MRNKLLFTAALGAALSALPLHEGEARACGGCFHPPEENPTIVTDHRMILSVSKEQSTLYDQVKYQGNPSSFAWVLPISGTVEVGLSADAVFQQLDQKTQTQIISPPQNCPPPPNCTNRGGAFGASDSTGSEAGSAAQPPGVQVTKQEVVGPYETVQLKATDANALQNWLQQNGFAVPADVQPIVNQYVAEKFDFLALKLIPGKGVQDMRPVRVTTRGANAVLPLRMVAAGTGAVVGISLWVFGEGRYEPQNFPFFSIKDEDLVWDWASSTSNYKELRAQRSAGLAGRGWEIETALQVNRSQLESVVTNIGRFNPSTGSDYAPVEANGRVVKTADQVRQEDLAALFKGIAEGQDYVTRLRADLAHAALTTDLSLIASGDQTQLAQVRRPKGEKGQPTCTVYSGCESVGTAPRDEAIARTEANNGGQESFSCETAKKKNTVPGFSLAGMTGLAAFLGLALIRARRARGR